MNTPEVMSSDRETPTNVPKETSAAVLSGSDPLPDDMHIVRGYDFSDETVDYEKLLNSYLDSGFQATHFGRAVNIVNKMVSSIWDLFVKFEL